VRRQLPAPTLGIVFGSGTGVVFAIKVHDVLRSVDPANPVAFGGVPLLIACVAMVATVLPTWRLLSGAPMRPLRNAEHRGRWRGREGGRVGQQRPRVDRLTILVSRLSIQER
jgi:predicted lysophospholipase L1 biosynthesis ABC-type transport system permease subunit